METYSPVLVGCLIDCSVNVLTEWSDILKYYLNPIFYSIAAATKRGSIPDVIRIGLVTYGDCESPSPVCARRFFASAPLILKEDMMGDPFGLGLGTVASDNNGMSILEGYVALLEMFDAAEITRPNPQSQVEEKPYEPVFYLIHIASCGPDKTTKPAFNNNPALDDVTWETLPAELSKRKIRHNLILLRSVGELIELSKKLNGPTASFGILPRKSTHKLLLAGLPHVENKTVPLKRPPSDQEEAASKHRRLPSQGQPGPSAVQPPPVQLPAVAPSSQPQQSSRVPTIPRLKTIVSETEALIKKKHKELQELIASKAPKERIESLHREITMRNQGRLKILHALQQLTGPQVPRGATGSGSTIQPVPGPSNQPVPGQGAGASKVGISTQPADASTSINSAVPVKGEMPARTSGGAGIDIQLSKMIAERVRPPVLAAAPQTQSQPQVPATAPPNSEQLQPTQPAGQGVTTANLSSEEIAQIMDMPTQISNYPRRWEGMLSWPTTLSGGERRELTLQVAFFSPDPNLNTGNWPKKVALQAGRKSVDQAFLQSCNKEFKPVMGLIIPWPSVGNVEMSARNYRLYFSMREVLLQRSTVGIAHMDIPNGPKGAGMVFLPVKSPQPLHRALLTMFFFQMPIPASIVALLSLPAAPSSSTQPNISGPGPTNSMPLQMTPEAQAFLQQQRNNALTAYTQQQILAQQAQRQAMLSNTGAPVSGAGVGAAYNINQFFQNMQAQAQQQQGGINANQGGLGGLGYPGQVPPMQQVQHRQPSGGYTPAQIAQIMQFGMNRPPDGGQGP